MRAFLGFWSVLLLLCTGTASAQQHGGVLRIAHRDSPGSLSIHEEATNSVVTVMMAVYNNLIVFDQHVKQNSLDTIRPDLAAQLGMERGSDRTDLQTSGRRKVA